MPRLLPLVALLAACEATPPPGWARGGAPLVLGDARWDRGGDAVELRADGRVLEDGDVLFKLDRAGRVFSDDNEAIALLLPDGRIAGNDDAYLGRIGLTNAAPPGQTNAWLSILPDGTVIAFDDEGDREHAGRWKGCTGPLQRACTLVTHLLLLQDALERPRTSVGIGVGVGVFR